MAVVTTLSAVLTVIVPAVWVTEIFVPPATVTVLPAFTNWLTPFVVVFPPVVKVKPALLIACATLLPVTRLVVSPAVTVPFTPAVKVVVLAANLLLIVAIVVLSVLAVTLYGLLVEPEPVTVVLSPFATDVLLVA